MKATKKLMARTIATALYGYTELITEDQSCAWKEVEALSKWSKEDLVYQYETALKILETQKQNRISLPQEKIIKARPNEKNDKITMKDFLDMLNERKEAYEDRYGKMEAITKDELFRVLDRYVHLDEILFDIIEGRGIST